MYVKIISENEILIVKIFFIPGGNVIKLIFKYSIISNPKLYYMEYQCNGHKKYFVHFTDLYMLQ